MNWPGLSFASQVLNITSVLCDSLVANLRISSENEAKVRKPTEFGNSGRSSCFRTAKAESLSGASNLYDSKGQDISRRESGYCTEQADFLDQTVISIDRHSVAFVGIVSLIGEGVRLGSPQHFGSRI
jgi:hypothetical protein